MKNRIDEWYNYNWYNYNWYDYNWYYVDNDEVAGINYYVTNNDSVLWR